MASALLPMLCSAGYDDSYLLSHYAKSVGTVKTTFGKKQNGEPYKIDEKTRMDAGYSSAGIGQLFEWAVTSYEEFDASTNGYILDYDPTFVNPKNISEFSLTISATHSSTYSFSFSKTESVSTSNRLSMGMNISGFGQVQSSTTNTVSFASTEGFTYSFVQSKTIQRTYTFDFSKVPDGYVVSPCLVCSAKKLDYTYTYYDHWWWGDYPVRTDELVNATNSVLIYDSNTLFVTIAIKKPSDKRPILYLKP